MNEIIGTIVGLNSFLAKDKVNVEVKYTADKSATAFTLAENRKYVIPAFQREIRWTEENLNVLVQDISRANKFLGNIILAQQTDDEYLIIDGQQRVSVLLMMIEYLKDRWGEEVQDLAQFSACSLSIDSFKSFSKFRDAKYNLEKLGLLSDKMDEIICAYSRMVIQCANNKFRAIQLSDLGMIDENAMNYYYKYNFKGEYIKYATEIINQLTSRLTIIND